MQTCQIKRNLRNDLEEMLCNPQKIIQLDKHCMKSVQIWSYFWSVFSCIWTGKYWPGITPYLNTFHTVKFYKWHHLIYRILDIHTKITSPKTYVGNKRRVSGLQPHFEKCNFCLNEKLAIIGNLDNNWLNKRSGVISQCCNWNKFNLINLTSHKTPNHILL